MRLHRLSLILLSLIWMYTVWWFPPERGLHFTEDDRQLSRIIAGETPGCPWEAKLAVGYVYSRNKVWFGSRNPTPDDALAALVWRYSFDYSFGGRYMISPADRTKMPWLRQRTNRWHCAHGYVETWQ